MRALRRVRAARSPRSATTSRRSTASARPRPTHILDFPEHFPGTRGGHARAQLPLHAADAGRGQRASPPRPRARSRSACAPTARAACRPRGRALPRRVRAGRARSATACCEAREQGMELRAQAVLMRTSHDSDLLELELTRRRDPVRQVRRPALPRGRARQGLRRAAAAGRQPRRRASPGSACCSCVEGVGPVSARARGRVDGAGGSRRAGRRRRGARPAGAWPRRASALAGGARARPPTR